MVNLDKSTILLKKGSNFESILLSFPTRERGLKSINAINYLDGKRVVPHAGTWIEIIQNTLNLAQSKVVPHAGTWIEISYGMMVESIVKVVPHAGTWIEISINLTE